MLLSTAGAKAQTTVYWDTNGATSGTGTAGGTWDQNTTSDWTTNTGGTATTGTWQALTGTSGIATFSAGTNATGSFTVNVSGTITGVRGITFQDTTSGNSILLSGGTLTLGATSTVNVANAGAVGAIGSVVTDGASTYGITKSGAGALTLSGANTYNGTTTLSVGTLNINNATAIGAGTLSIAAGTTIDNTSGVSIALSNNNAVTVGGNFTFAGTGGSTLDLGTGAVSLGAANRQFTITNGNLILGGVVTQSSGSRSLLKAGAGTLTLKGANTYSGNTTISAGTLSTTNLKNGGTASGIGNSSNVATNLVLNGGTLQYTGAAQSSNRLFTLGLGATAGTIDASGSGALNLTNTGSMGFTGSGTRTLTLTGNNTGANTLAAVVGNSGGATALTKDGSGNWTLSGSNTYTGVTTISGGTLVTSNLKNGGTASNIGQSTNAASNLVLNGGTLQYTGAAQSSNRLFTLGTGSTAGTIDASGSGALNLTNTGSMGFSGSGTRTLTLTGNNTGANTLAAVIGDSGGATSLVKNGAGAWTLTAANSYTGGTLLNTGTLNVNNAGALGTGILGVAANTTLDNTSAAAITLTNAGQSWNGNFTFTGTKDLDLGTGTVALTATPTVAINGGNFTVGGVVSGAGFGLTKSGAGTLIFGGANTYSGATTVSQGSLVLTGNAPSGSAGTLGNASSAVVLNDGNTGSNNTSLLIGASGVTVGRDLTVANAGTGTTTLGGNITSGTGTFTGAVALNRSAAVNADGTSNVTFSGALSGSGGLTKTGTGTVTLNGSSSNTYSGTTTVNAGMLALAKTGPAIAVAGNLVLGNGSGTATVQLGADNQIATTSAVTFNNTGGTPTLDLNGHSQTVASIASTNAGATVALGSPGSATTFTVGDASDTTFSGAITGGANAAFVKQGAGTLTLNSTTSSYTGGTSVNAGAINAASNNALGTGDVTVANNATLQLSTNGVSVGSGSATATLSGSGTGVGGNNGALLNVGGGTTRLNNNVALAADATISSGTTSGATLIVGGTPPGYTPGISAPDTNTLALGAHNLTFVGAAATTTQVDADITGTGNVTVNTSGTVHYNANKNTYTGTTAVNNGTLIVDTANNDFAPHSTSTSFWGINGPLVIGDGTGAANSAVVQLGATGSTALNHDVINSTAPVTIYSDGYLNLNTNDQNIGQLTMSGGTIDTSSTGTLYLDYANTAVTINPTSTSGTATINGTLSLTYWKDAATEGSNPNQTRTFTVNHDSSNTSDLTINAVIGNGSLIKNGTGTMTLATSNNTYTGSTTINNGILNVQVGTDVSTHRSSLGSGDNDNSTGAGTTVNSGGTLQMQGGIAITNEQLTLNGAGFNPGTGALGALNNLSGNNTWGGGPGTGTIALGSDATTTSTAGLLTINATMSSASGTGYGLTVDGAGNTTISSSINTGSTGTVTKTGSGTLILAGNSGYSGATYVTQGVTSVQNNGALGFVTTGTDGTFVNSGAELQLSNVANGNLTVGGESLVLNGAGIGGTSGALHNVAGNNTFGGQIRVGEAFTAGANNYSAAAATILADTGTTLTLSGGTTSANNLGLTVGGAGNTTISGDMSNGTGSLTKTGTGTLAINGTTATVGQTHLTQGTISVGGSTTLGTKEFDATAGTTLTIATGGTVVSTFSGGLTTFSGQINQSGLTSTSTGGTFEIIGTTLADGLKFNGTTFNAGANSTLILAGGTLSLLGSQITFGTIHITGNTVLDFNSSANTFLTSGSLVIDSGVTVTVQGWISSANTTTASTIWYATNTVNSQTLGGTDLKGGTPLSQVTFSDYPGLTTTWVSGSHDGWFDHEIRPTPEPAAYGVLLLSASLGLLGWRRFARRDSAAARS